MSESIVLSLNEVESLAAKATRGAGLGWGQAEDLGRAARWLASRALPWAKPLSELLVAAPHCPGLHRTLALADRVRGASGGTRWMSEPVEPAWVLAFVSAALYGRDVAVRLDAGGGAAWLNAVGGVAMEDWLSGPASALDVEILPASSWPALDGEIGPRTRRSAIPVPVWSALNAFAARTYVAASAGSRARGAGGAGLDGE